MLATTILKTEMDYHFINFSRNRTGQRQLAPIKSTTTVGEGPEENGLVGPVESIMMSSRKMGISPKSIIVNTLLFSIQRRPSPAKK
jgi:hypothetical protein